MQKSNAMSGLKLLMLFVVLFWVAKHARRDWMFKPEIRMPTERGEEEEEAGTRWAVLMVSSSGFGNYRYQADVCHAYQILRRGRLKEGNVVVFMYDDIAGHGMNPRLGIIINHPKGEDVYSESI